MIKNVALRVSAVAGLMTVLLLTAIPAQAQELLAKPGRYRSSSSGSGSLPLWAWILIALVVIASIVVPKMRASAKN